MVKRKAYTGISSVKHFKTGTEENSSFCFPRICVRHECINCYTAQLLMSNSTAVVGQNSRVTVHTTVTK